MCGPLVALLGRHQYRFAYFLGRTLSFSFVGLLSGAFGAYLYGFLKIYEVQAIVSFGFGVTFFAIGFGSLGYFPLFKSPLSKASAKLSLLLLRESFLTTFLFGLFTVLLPCGQTLLVFSACALAQDALVGLGNGFAFALLTSPSLMLAMRAAGFLGRYRQFNTIITVMAFLIGAYAFLKGIRELGEI